jgi:6-phosphogluconolactonase
VNNSQCFLYVGRYAAIDEPGIHAFLFDTLTGNLTPGWSFSGISNPSFILLHPNGHWLYAVSEAAQDVDGGSGAVWALDLSDQTDVPRALNHQASGGESPCHLSIDATGKWLFVSNYGSGTLGVLPILEDGSLGPLNDLIQHYGHGLHPERQEGPHTHSATLTPDNRFLIVADLGIDQLVIYAFSPSVGKLHLHSQVPTPPGSGPRHVVFHPQHDHLYVSCELDNTVIVYGYQADTCHLEELQVSKTVPPEVLENAVADIHISPAGERLYVSNRGHNSLAVFAIEADRRVKRIALPSCGGEWPRHFAIAPDARFVLVANEHSGEVTVLPALDTTRTLGEPVARVAVPNASCVQFATTS